MWQVYLQKTVCYNPIIQKIPNCIYWTSIAHCERALLTFKTSTLSIKAEH